MINDPRLEYQKLIEQNNRFFTLVFFAGYSAIAALASKFESIAVFSMPLVVMTLSSFIGIICFNWHGKNNYLNHRINAAQKIARRNDETFRELVWLEKSLHKKSKLFIKGIIKFEPTHFDNALPTVMFYISSMISTLALAQVILDLIEKVSL